jgi:DNA invertase Pin-like site-specific DNA recombinase
MNRVSSHQQPCENSDGCTLFCEVVPDVHVYRAIHERTRPTMSDNRAIGYIRVSTQEQAAYGVSLDAQRERIQAYCLMSGLELIEIVSDEGVSGTVTLSDREGGHRLTEAISKRNSTVTNVVSLKLDRLFRDACDALEQTKTWDKAGVTLHLIDLGGQTLCSSGAMGRLFLTIMAAFAELERNLIAERTKAALQHKKSHKTVYNHEPFGFVRQDDRLIENPDELRVVARIIELRSQGTPLARIADALNESNIPTKQGKRWYASTISNVLSNSLYQALQV